MQKRPPLGSYFLFAFAVNLRVIIKGLHLLFTNICSITDSPLPRNLCSAVSRRSSYPLKLPDKLSRDPENTLSIHGVAPRLLPLYVIFLPLILLLSKGGETKKSKLRVFNARDNHRRSAKRRNSKVYAYRWLNFLCALLRIRDYSNGYEFREIGPFQRSEIKKSIPVSTRC